MKNVKLMLLAVIAILFLGMGSVNAQEKEPQTVIIKVYEFPIMYKSRMIITEPSGTSKTVELKTLSYKSLEDVVAANNLSVQTEVNKWKKEGYRIEAFSCGSMGDASLTTIILSKDE